VEPGAPKPTEAQQRIKTQNGKKSDQADRVGVDLASSKRGSIALPLPNLTGALAVLCHSKVRSIGSHRPIIKPTAEKLDGR
jgi:hypothetical protein